MRLDLKRREGVCGAHPICESAHIHFDFEVKEEEVKSSWFYPEPMHSTAAGQSRAQ